VTLYCGNYEMLEILITLYGLIGLLGGFIFGYYFGRKTGDSNNG